MRCKSCKHDIDDDSIFCKYCGERQIRERRNKAEVKVPAPKQLPSGTWFGRLMVDGQRVAISAPSEKDYYVKARAIKTGLVQIEKAPAAILLKTACADYISKRDAVLSPSTVRGYDTIMRTRFLEYMDSDIRKIDYQRMINDEAAKGVSGKTIKNAWGFIKSALKEKGIAPPSLTLPQVVSKDLPWLERDQIITFLKAIEGKECELAALFALHGLRRSELYALTPANIRDGVIYIEGSVVLDRNGQLIRKSTNKNTSSRREVKIRIPRLQALIDADTRAADEPYITLGIAKIYVAVNKICEENGLGKVGMHGLRRSFASLAYSLGWSELATMKEGGWSDRSTMNKHYVKLAAIDALKQGDSMSEFYEHLSLATALATNSKNG